MADCGAFSWRALEPRDAGDWAVLLAAIRTVDHGWEYFTEQDLLEDFGDPLRDFAAGSIAAYDDGVMVGYGLLTSGISADPVHQVYYQGGVHPAYRERGLGSALLGWAEKAAVPLHRERYPDRPLSLSGSCLSHSAGAVALFAGHGYRPARWFHAMVRNLTAPLPESAPPPGVEIVGFTAEWSEDTRIVQNEVFLDHWGSNEMTAQEWAHFLAFGAFRPEFSFLAFSDGGPVGFVIGHEYDAYAEATGLRDLYIPLVGTRRASRKQGIASALLGRALAGARDAGFAQASLKVDADSPTGALGLYQRAGFVVEHTAITQIKPVLEESADPQ